MLKIYFDKLIQVSFIAIVTSLPLVLEANEVTFKFKTQDIAENLSFRGASRWDYKINKISANKIIISFPHKISEDSINEIKKVNGKYIKSISVTKNELSGSETVIKLRKNILYFDYLTDQPSTLVVDFYTDSKKIVKKQVKKSNKKNQSSSNRAPASSEFIQFDKIGADINKIILGDNNKDIIRKGVFDSADPEYKRFEIPKNDFDYRKIKKNIQGNTFVRFPILYRESHQLAALLEELPLHVIKTKNKKETKEAQLIHKLYTSKTWAAFNKMYRYFNKTYPKSKYKNLLRSLATSAYYQLWQQTNDKKYLTLAENQFLKFKKEFPENRVTEYWDKILFYTNLQLKQGLEAARIGESILKKYPLNESTDIIKLNLADAYLQASQYGEASRLYKDLKNGSVDPKVRQLASFTEPIVDLKQQKEASAIGKYLEAKKEYQVKNDPSYYFNLGEAYFWKGDLYRSSKLYRKFIKQYPKHRMNNFAITRIGEIMSLVGYPNKKYLPVLLESIYRYKGLKGADIAEIRVNSLKVPKSKKTEEEHYISEIKRIAGKYDDLNMRYYKEITLADALTNSEKFMESNEYLEPSYKRNPYSPLVGQIKSRIVNNIEQKMKKHLDNKDYLAAIELYEHNRQTWLADINKPIFKRILARSFEMAGMNNYALAHYVDYVGEKTNSNVDNQVLLSMARLYQKNKDYDNMDKYLKILSDTGELSEQDSFDAVKLKFEVYDEKAIYDRAENLLQSYKNTNIKNKDIKIKTSFMISDFYKDRGKYQKALNEVKNLESSYSQNSEHFYPLSKRIVKLHVRNGDEVSAINKLQNLIDLKEFQDDQPFIFYVGNLLINNNENELAEKVWSKIKDPKSMYAKIINEKRKHLKWEKNYGKYINRIPAMSN